MAPTQTAQTARAWIGSTKTVHYLTAAMCTVASTMHTIIVRSLLYNSSVETCRFSHAYRNGNVEKCISMLYVHCIHHEIITNGCIDAAASMHVWQNEWLFGHCTIRRASSSRQMPQINSSVFSCTVSRLSSASRLFVMVSAVELRTSIANARA